MKGKLAMVSIAATLFTLAIGLLVITGWIINNDTLRSLLPGAVSMKFNIALAFVFASIVLLLHRLPLKNKPAHFFKRILAAVIALIGFLTLLEYLLAVDLGIDELFFRDLASSAAYPAGRMSVISAMNLFLAGIGLLILNRKRTIVYQFYYLTAIIFISVIMLIALNFISDSTTLIYMPVYSAAGFIFLCIAIYFSQPMLQENISFERKLLTAFLMTFILIIVIGVFSGYYSSRRISTSQMVRHTNEVLIEGEQTLSLVKDIEGGARGYMISGDSAYLEYFSIALKELPRHINNLKEFTKDNPVQLARIDSLSNLLNKRIAYSQAAITLRNGKGLNAVTELLKAQTGKSYSNQIRQLVDQVKQEENNLLVQRQIENTKSVSSFNRAFYIFLSFVFIILVIIFFTIRRNIHVRKKTEASLSKLNNDLEQMVSERTEQLASSELRFRSIIEQYPSPVIRYAPNGSVISANPAWETMWDDKVENAKYYNIRKDPQMLISGLSVPVEKAFSGKVAITDIYKYDPALIGKKGRERWIQLVMYPLKDTKGNILEVIAVTLDMTENKEAQEKLMASEKQFRYTLDNMLEGAQIIDFNWRYIYVNDSLARHGKYSKEELIGHTVMEKYPGIEHTEIFKVYQRCFEERVSIHLENEFIFPDGSKGWFELSFQPVPEGIFILSIDITDRKRSEFELQKLNEGLEQKIRERTNQLENVNKELEAFSYSVSHDLRAPLRGIVGFTDMLEEKYIRKLDEEAQRLTSVIKNNTLKMGTLIDDLLSFSRMGRQDIVKLDFSTAEMVKEIIADFDYRNTNITWDLGPLPDSYGDANTLRQVWINLVSNAVKYSKNATQPHIEIGSTEDNRETVFFVKDNGVGFDSKYKDKLFKVFQRLHSAGEFEGTGVGLAIVEKVISKHGGKVWVEAEKNKGACFYFSLPHKIIS